MNGRQPIDDHRRAVFLDVLRRTGSMAAAAAAATPRTDGGKENRAGYRSFLDEMKITARLGLSGRGPRKVDVTSNSPALCSHTFPRAT